MVLIFCTSVPLRALINDQFRRLEDLCEIVDLPVHPWHGDISAAIKSKARKNPRGILLITPESLEAMFVLRGLEIPVFSVSSIVSSLTSCMPCSIRKRGIQLRSLLSRLEFTARRRIRRIGLSATLGEMDLATQYLRPEAPQAVTVLQSRAEGPVLRLQLRGYRIPKPASGVRKRKESTEDQTPLASTQRVIATHLFDKLRGTTNLIFAGSRQDVEVFSDLLRRISEQQHLPTNFNPHYASLSREHRAFLERRVEGSNAPDNGCLHVHVGARDRQSATSSAWPRSGLRSPSPPCASVWDARGVGSGQPAVLRMYTTNGTSMQILIPSMHSVSALYDPLQWWISCWKAGASLPGQAGPSSFRPLSTKCSPLLQK